MKTIKRIIDAFRNSISESAPLSLVQSFIAVCENEGKGVVELAEIVGSSRTTMSRHLLDLSESLRSGADGYKLLQRTQDPSNMRSVVYTLTPKGKVLRNTLLDLLE
ncbi:hypothetical protein H5V43_06860 [Sphingobium fuliginis]|uniref:MarR family transcriptional regulator n=1 Tax=Sphingobium fuliginis (strain ATCC 27551) TaxID=336203 RepID=A0A7M2GJD2_SPHSA|nr:hypothetical protein [Sphingobium fuliginis]QOT72826.1 hypothetical protein H5V43_06860 [Sphingobium fuliginis]